jgi:hypothetical protein
MERQRTGRCLTCGSQNHKTEQCRQDRSGSMAHRPPTPRNDSQRDSSSRDKPDRDSASSSRQKVNFNVATVVGEPRFGEGRSVHSRRGDPRAFGREGDVEEGYADDEDAAVVEAYMAARALRPVSTGQSPSGYNSGYTSQSDFD